MKEYLGAGIFGIICIFLGLQNRKRVKEDDVLSYGKQIGMAINGHAVIKYNKGIF